MADEAKTLRELRRVYEKAREDVIVTIKTLEARTDVENLQSIIYQKSYQEALKKQIDSVLDMLNTKQFTTISDYLAQSYEDGFFRTVYDLHNQGIPLIFPMNQDRATAAIQIDTKLSRPLYDSLGVDIEKLKNSIRANLSRGIASNSSWVDVARNIDARMGITMRNSMRIVRTEGHRIQCEAQYDAQVKAKEKGADVVKQWDATLDRRTRPTHQRLDGQIREIDEPFELDGHTAMYPGGFGIAKEDINCRCRCNQRAKWALDEEELETLKKRAEYYGLDKAKDFEEFKQKYLEATKTEENTKLPQPQKEEKNEEPETLKKKIDTIKERIDSNGGVIQESDLMEAGSEFRTEIEGKITEETNATNEKIREITEQYDALSKEEALLRERKDKLDEFITQESTAVDEEDFDVFSFFEAQDKAYNSPEHQKQVEEIEQIEEQIKELKQKQRSLLDQRRGVESELREYKTTVVKTTLSEVREVGIGAVDVDSHLTGRSPMRGVVTSAYDYYPTDWVQKAVDRGTLYVKKVDRGFYDDYNGILAISDGNFDGGLTTAVHEIGHRMERSVSEILGAEKTFYERRTAGESLAWLGGAYSKSEKTRKDNFLNPYMGKDYGGQAYELVSMGFQYAFTEPEKLLKDQDMAEWIFGLLTLE